MIDWARIAKPQDNLYDTGVIWTMDTEWLPTPRDPNHRRTGDVYLAEQILVCPTEVHRYNDPAMLPVGDRITQEWADLQNQTLNGWPAGYRALQTYMDEFWPFLLGMPPGGRGCSSGHHRLTRTLPIHASYVSIDDPGGCAQGIYHEFAHLRLESLGIGIDSHDGRLLANANDELYNSSVRFDCKRPMSAVVHGVYAWLMFTQNDWMNYFSGRTTRSEFRTYVENNLPKIAAGVEEIKAYARWTPDGEQFIAGMYQWAEELIATCTEKLR